MALPDYYEALGVPRFYVTQDEILDAYLLQLKQLQHEMAECTLSVTAEQAQLFAERAQLLADAYATLSDVHKKRAYDEQLANHVNAVHYQWADDSEFDFPKETPLNSHIPITPAPPSIPTESPQHIPQTSSFSFKALSQSWAIRSTLFLSTILVVLFLLNIAIYDTPSAHSSPSPSPISASRPPMPTPVPTSTPTPTVYPTSIPLPLPQNGEILTSAWKRRDFPQGLLTIETSGSHHHLVRLRDWYTNENVLTFFVRAGQSVDIDVPIGKYTLSYATGDNWYGRNHLFGDSTSYAIADDPFLFEDYGDSTTWWTVELYLQNNGNLDTSSISPEDF
jgi:hypothetical protein